MLADPDQEINSNMPFTVPLQNKIRDISAVVFIGTSICTFLCAKEFTEISVNNSVTELNCKLY